MKADIWFPTLLLLRTGPPITPPTPCYMPTVSQGPASLHILLGFLTCAFAIGCSKQFPFYKPLFLPPDSIKLLEAWEQLSHYPIWTWTLSLRRFTDHWAASLPWLLAATVLWSQHSVAHSLGGGHHILFFSQAWYRQAWYILLKWLNISTFFPLK